jgi:hypothetical protein
LLSGWSLPAVGGCPGIPGHAVVDVDKHQT